MRGSNKRGLLKKLQWALEYSAFLVVERLVGLLSMASLWRTGAALSGCAHLFRSRWPIVRNNLRSALGPATDEKELSTLTREVFRHTAANLLTALKGSRLSSDLVRGCITTTGDEILISALREEKGVILISPHMGNFELLSQGLGAFHPELKVAGIYRPLNNIYLDPLIQKRRSHHGMKLFSKFTSYSAPMKFLRNGGVLGILADQRAGPPGTIVPFFGRLMSMSPLPAFMHKHTGAPIVGVSMKTISPGRWEVAFHELSLSRNEEVTTAHIAYFLEEMTSRSFVDVFWMQDLWRTNKRRPLEISGKKGPLRLKRDRGKDLYPFSVLVRVPDKPQEFTQTITALNSLVESRPDFDLHLLARESLRAEVRQTGIAHTFHPVEDCNLPPTLSMAIALTDDESSARDLADLYEGPVYSLPGSSQSRKNWNIITIEQDLTPEQRWLEVARSLGMHDPPLQLSYI